MKSKKRILLKLTGNIFLSQDGMPLSTEYARKIAHQIKKLTNKYQFGIVVGGGNILRGDQQDKKIGLTPSFGHQVGMFATMINGFLLQDILEQNTIASSVLSSIFCPQIGDIISGQAIKTALENKRTIIFVGGTGSPFFSTDTNAIVRSLQIGADEVWKATDVDGIFDTDPNINPNATMVKKIKYSDAISKKLGIMDITAMIMAEKHDITLKIFNIFTPNALIKASEDKEFGSIIHK